MNARICFLTVLFLVSASLSGCIVETADSKEAKQVRQQQMHYNEHQPVPFFDWSLQRDLWKKWYEAQNRANVSWYYIFNLGTQDPVEVGISVGSPIPMDTQLTNPLQLSMALISDNEGGNGRYVEGVIEQAEPNGLFTSKNTDGTVVMKLLKDGSICPHYTELKVHCTFNPTRWDRELHRIVDIEGKASISLPLDQKAGKLEMTKEVLAVMSGDKGGSTK